MTDRRAKSMAVFAAVLAQDKGGYFAGPFATFYDGQAALFSPRAFFANPLAVRRKSAEDE